MSRAAAGIRVLQRLPRGVKFVMLLVAAWCPVALPRHPMIVLCLMGIAAGLFLTSTTMPVRRIDGEHAAPHDSEAH